jgi:hypothetical protein
VALEILLAATRVLRRVNTCDCVSISMWVCWWFTKGDTNTYSWTFVQFYEKWLYEGKPYKCSTTSTFTYFPEWITRAVLERSRTASYLPWHISPSQTTLSSTNSSSHVAASNSAGHAFTVPKSNANQLVSCTEFLHARSKKIQLIERFLRYSLQCWFVLQLATKRSKLIIST